MTSENSLTGRLKRYTSVSTGLTSLAARLLGQKMGFPLDTKTHAHDLKDILGHLKGPLMKAAQLLATIPDALPREYTQALLELQSQAPAMGWPFVKRRMSRELGADWACKFESFERNAAAAASLGQVHRAISLEGAPLACKLQYPNMDAAVEADLKQLKLFLGLYETYDKAVCTKEIQKEIADRLREEVDYAREAKHINLYRYILKDEPGIECPQVFEDLSTHRLLTMTWLEGKSLLDPEIQNQPLETRNTIARRMLRAWYIPFYRYGVIHGDPHLGNYTVQGNNTINLLDYGCVRIFPPTFIKGVIDLYRSFETNNRELAVQAYQSWGFKDLNPKVMDILSQWAHYLYDPLLDDRVRPIETEFSGKPGQKVASSVQEALRKAGGVTPPKAFVFMDRAAVGLGSVFLHLRAELNWHQEFKSLFDEFDVEKVEQRQAAALRQAGLPLSAELES